MTRATCQLRFRSLLLTMFFVPPLPPHRTEMAEGPLLSSSPPPSKKRRQTAEGGCSAPAALAWKHGSAERQARRDAYNRRRTFAGSRSLSAGCRRRVLAPPAPVGRRVARGTARGTAYVAIGAWVPAPVVVLEGPGEDRIAPARVRARAVRRGDPTAGGARVDVHTRAYTP